MYCFIDITKMYFLYRSNFQGRRNTLQNLWHFSYLSLFIDLYQMLRIVKLSQKTFPFKNVNRLIDLCIPSGWKTKKLNLNINRFFKLFAAAYNVNYIINFFPCTSLKTQICLWMMLVYFSGLISILICPTHMKKMFFHIKIFHVARELTMTKNVSFIKAFNSFLSD